MNLETWLSLYRQPGESREDAVDRYIVEQGVTDPAEKESIKGQLTTPDPVTPTPVDYFDDTPGARYRDEFFGSEFDLDRQEPFMPPSPEEEYVADPDWMDQLGASADTAHAGIYSAIGGQAGGALEDLDQPELASQVRDWADTGRAEQQRQADLIAKPKTSAEILEEDPESLYKYLPEYTPTGHELVRGSIPSLTPYAMGLGLTVASAPLLAAAGLTGTGLAVASGLTGMSLTNLASSFYVSGQEYERVRDDPSVREGLGIHPTMLFKELPQSDQRLLTELRHDMAQTTFGRRLYTSGLVEMLSFARYGGKLFRWGMDMGLGATSEVWDEALYAENAANTMVEYGIPLDVAEKIREKIVSLGPSQKELWTQSLIYEGVYGGGFLAAEHMAGDKRIDGWATSSKKQQEVQEEFQKNRNKIKLKSEEQALLGTDTKLRQKTARDAVALESGYKNWEDMEAQEKDIQNAYKFKAGSDAYRARQASEKKVRELEAKAEAKSKKEQEDYGRDEVAQMIRAEEQSIKLARGTNFTATRKALEREREILDNIRARLPSSTSPVRKDGTLLTSEEIFDINAIRRKRETQLLNLQKREAALDKSEKEFEKAHPLKTSEQLKKQTKKEAKKEVDRPKVQVLKSAIDSTTTGEVTTERGVLKRLFDMFQSKNKAKYVVLDKTEDTRLANIFGGQEYLADAQGHLEGSEGFVHEGIVYLVADNIKGATPSEAINRAVQVGVFHEPIAHLGLRKFLETDKKFDSFLDDFYASNTQDINDWARTEVTPEGVPAYLDEDHDPDLLRKPGLRQRLKLKKKTDTGLSTDKKRELAEEYLAHKFTEYGVRDPHILERLDDSLKTSLSSIVGKKRVSKIQARTMLASIQRDYVGGERNIITGDFFDPSNWVKSKPLALVEEEQKEETEQTAEEKVEAYREHLRKGTKADVTPIGTEELLTEDVEEARGAKRKAGFVHSNVQGELDRVEANKQVRIKAEAKKLKEKKQKAKEKATQEALSILGIRSSKRTMSLRDAQAWAANPENQKGKGRRPRVPELASLAKTLRKGDTTYEEYQDAIDRHLPIEKFEAVPEIATDEEILGSIKTRQYEGGQLLSEANLGDELVDVRLDIPAYERFNTWIATITRSPRKGTPKIYGGAVHLKNVEFKTSVEGALRIAEGEGKGTIATMRGQWQGTSDAAIKGLAGVRANKSAWIEIGYNPERQSTFYIKENKGGFTKGTPLASAEEVMQIGGYVLAKRPVTKAVPSKVIDGKTIRFAKLKVKAYGGTAQVEENVIAALQANPKLSELIKYMTPQELDLLTTKSADRMVATLEARAPLGIRPGETGFDTEELMSMALAGQIHKGWYINSLGAINHVFGADAPRFIGLLSALSPQSKVETSTNEAADLWAAWTKANRPTDKAQIIKIATKAIPRFGGMTTLHGNTVRTLSVKNPKKIILSGPKVQSFYNNLMGNLDEVTHDTWMWNVYGILKDKIGSKIPPSGLSTKTPTYTIASAKLREAADMLTKETGQTWKPAEVQETIWSFYKALTEFAAKKDRRAGRTLDEIVVQEDLTQRIEEIPDFAKLLDGTAVPLGKGQNYAQKINDTLTKAGYGKQIATLSTQPVLTKAMGGATPTFKVEGIGKVAKRLEAQKPSKIERIRASKKVDTLGAKGGDASLVDWADQGKWFNFGPIKDINVFINIVASVDHQITSFLMHPKSEYQGVWQYHFPEEFIKIYTKKLDGPSIADAVKKMEKEGETEEVLYWNQDDETMANTKLLRKDYDNPLPIYNQVLKEMGRTWNDVLVYSWLKDSKFNKDNLSYDADAGEIIKSVFDPFKTNQSIKAPHRLVNVNGFIDSRLANPELLQQNQQLVEKVAYWGLDGPFVTEQAEVDAIDNLKKDWLEIIQGRHNEIIDYNADYLERQYQHDPTFQSAMLRANLYGRRNDTIDMPAQFIGAALDEVAQKFGEGGYASLKHMKKDYAIIAKRKSDEEDAREKRRSARIPSVEEGVWVELKQVPEGATREEAGKIYQRWKEASYENWCTHSFASETYPHEGPMYVLTREEEPLIAIRYVGNKVFEIRSQANNNRVPLKYIPDIKAFLEGMKDLDPDRMGSQSQLILENAEKEAEIIARIGDKVKPFGKQKTIDHWKELAPEGWNAQDGLPKSEWYDYIELKDGTWAATGYGIGESEFKFNRLPNKDDHPVTILVGDLSYQEFSRGTHGTSNRKPGKYKIGEREFPRKIKEIAGKATLSGVTIDDLQTVYGQFTAGEEQFSIAQIDRKGQSAEEVRLEFEEIKAEYKAKGLLDTPTDTDTIQQKYDISGQQTRFEEAERELIKRVSQITYLPALRDVGEGVVTLRWNVSIPNLTTLANELVLEGDADVPKLETVEKITLSSYGAHAPALMNVNDDFLWEVKPETSARSGESLPHIKMQEKGELPALDFNKLEEVGGRVVLDGTFNETESPKDLQLESLHSIGEGLNLHHESNPTFPNLYLIKGGVHRDPPMNLQESSYTSDEDKKNKKFIKYKDYAKNAKEKAFHAPNLTLVGHSISIYEHDYLPNLQRVGKNINLYIDGDLEQVQKTLARMDKENFLPSLTHVGGHIMIFAPAVDKGKHTATRYLHPGGKISTQQWTTLIETEKVDSDFTGYADENNFTHRKIVSNEYSPHGLRRLEKEEAHAAGTDPNTGYWYPNKEYGDTKPQGVALMYGGDHAIVSDSFPNIAPQLKYTYDDETNPYSRHGGGSNKNIPEINYSQARWFSAVWEGTELDPRQYGIPKVDSRFSKLKKTPNEEELEAEWRSVQRAKKTSDTRLPPKKDKVTLSKKARAILDAKPTAKDLTHAAILDPKGNVRSSKVLMSRAARHAVDTRSKSWNPLKKWTGFAQPFADSLTKRLVSQGTLPDSDKYKALRRRVKGIILAGETAGKKVYDALKKSKQKELIFKYLTTKDFNPNQIKDLGERQTAISAKKQINEIGEMLVERNLMKKKTKEQYEGEYLPKVYLKYLLGEDNFRKATTKGGMGLDMSYLIGRKDIPEGIRKLILGEIEDPGYLASKAVAVPQKDIAIIDWLKSIAGNANWVLPSSLIQYDVLGKMKSLTASVDLQKQLELVDTDGSQVSAFWLANEADRIFSQTKLMDLSDVERKIVVDLTEDMKAQAQAQIAETQGKIDPKLYSMVPTTPKYGQLAGMAVRKEIAQDIFGSMSMTTGDISLAESVFGDGGTVGDYNRIWKWSKVSANPPSWVRNFVSNLTLMNLGDVPFARMPDLMLSSLTDMLKKGKHKGRLHQLAKDIGLTSGNFSSAELGRIETEFKDLMQRMSAKDKSGMRVLGPIKGAFNVVRDSTSNLYGGIDSLGKMMMLKYKMDQSGLKIKDIGAYSETELALLHDAAYDAEKYLFDYSNPLPSVKWLRRAPFGAPFISFTSFAAPLILEAAITKPWKFLPYYLLGYSAKELFKSINDLDEEDYEGLKVSMSDYLREKAEGAGPYPVIPWPYIDENGRIQFIDVSYLYPWGMFSEVLGELFSGDFGKAIRTAGLMGSPAVTTASAIITGVDGFTRQPIVDDFGTWDEQAADMGWFAFNLTMPPMLHGIGQGPGQGYGAVKRLWEAFHGQLNKEGEARFTLPQATARMAGINITPIAVPEGRNKQLRYEYSRMQKLLRLAKRDIVNMIMMQESKEDIQEAAKDYRKKIQKMAGKFSENVKTSKPPVSLLRQREAVLKKRRRAAVQSQ